MSKLDKSDFDEITEGYEEVIYRTNEQINLCQKFVNYSSLVLNSITITVLLPLVYFLVFHYSDFLLLEIVVPIIGKCIFYWVVFSLLIFLCEFNIRFFDKTLNRINEDFEKHKLLMNELFD